MTIATSYHTVGSNSPGGDRLGHSSSSKIGFYGTVPIARPTGATSVTTTAATSTTNAYGYTTAAQADAIVTAVNVIITLLGTTSGVGLTS